MGRRPPHCLEEGSSVRRAWTAMEDKILTEYIKIHGEGQWKYVPQKAGLERSGKSCRLRWLNYLKPGIKRGNISQEEEDLIIKLHQDLGNRWSLIAGRLPGRTDNEIKNYWYTKISQKTKHVNCDGDSTASSDSKPSNDHEFLEGPSLNTKKQQGVCEVPAPSHQNEVDETTSMPWPTKSWDVFGVHDEQFETILSPVMILEENYQLMHDDVWMDFEIWSNLS